MFVQPVVRKMIFVCFYFFQITNHQYEGSRKLSQEAPVYDNLSCYANFVRSPFISEPLKKTSNRCNNFVLM